MNFSDDEDLFDGPAAGQTEGTRQVARPLFMPEVESSPVAPDPIKAKRVARYLGDSDDDDANQATLNALFEDVDNMDEDGVLPPPLNLIPKDKAGAASNKRSAEDDKVDDVDGIADAAGDGKKPRAPRAKLDEERLLGPKGFSKLREDSKRFKVSFKRKDRKETPEVSRRCIVHCTLLILF